MLQFLYLHHATNLGKLHVSEFPRCIRVILKKHSRIPLKLNASQEALNCQRHKK